MGANTVAEYKHSRAATYRTIPFVDVQARVHKQPANFELACANGMVQCGLAPLQQARGDIGHVVNIKATLRVLGLATAAYGND
jgi:hypothetical protein